MVIDHVLFRGFGDATTTADRVMDGQLQVNNCDMDITTGYSDHYGVSATVTP